MNNTQIERPDGRAPLVGLASGLLFGFGLWLGGMTDPQNVQGFLDLSGDWMPALAFVLGAAVLVSSLSYRIAARRSAPTLGGTFEIPGSKGVDKELLLGAAIFGAGWGLAGYCPGPALVGIGQGSLDALWFSTSMIAGMFVYSRLWHHRRLNSST